MLKSTTLEFINKSQEIHSHYYDYSLVNYKNNATKVKIICPIHGIFEQRPLNHLSGQRCKKCVVETNKINQNEIIKRFINIHYNKYDYNLVEYTSIHKVIKIICSEHGVFEQTPSNHLKGQGCMMCKLKNQSLNNTDFITKSSIKHDNKYDYSLVEYIGTHKKVKIICKKHGIFEQSPNSHLNGKGCPICKESKGERLISKFLNDNNIEYIREKRFDTCKGKITYPFDFYLPDYNCCVEFDGIQHFKPIEFFGGENSLSTSKIRDNIKTKFCKDNEIKLIRIKYDEKINEKLNEFFYLLL